MSVTLLKPNSLPSTADPVYETLRSPERPTRGRRVAWLGERLGLPLMPWQRLVADVGLEMVEADDQILSMFAARGVDVSGGLLVPAYREVIVTIMRQNGKSTLIVPVSLEVLWEPGRMVAYTAQSGVDARQQHVEAHQPLIRNSPLDAKIRQYYKAADNTGLWLTNDSRLKVLNTGETVGHGKTLDLAVLDETWADKDESREQALSPAMVTRPQAQFWNVSTAGTPASVFLQRKVELGRAAAASGKREGVAYFEWAIPDDEDIYSPDVWARYMPAYGITISERILRLEADRLTEGNFRRAYGNQWTETDERVIPAEVWRAVCDKNTAADPASVYVIDAHPDRSQACVFKAGGGVVELVAVRPGVDWLVEAFDSLAQRLPIVVDKTGPASGQADRLEASGHTVVRYESLQVRKACGRFYDAIADRKITVRSDERLDEAVKHAAQRSNADSWAWHREAPGGEMLVGMSIAFDASQDAWVPTVATL